MSHTETKPAAKPAKPRTYGLLAEYNTPGELLHAAEQVRDAGFKAWDCCTPFPVHGLDRAMGIRPTILPWIVLIFGLKGLTVATLMQWYVNTPHLESGATYLFSSYPLIISGKPFWSLPANVPVMFELTVLFSALSTFVGVWALCRLPRLHHPLFNAARFKKVTDDKFFLVIEASDPKYRAADTKKLLEATSPAAIEEVKD